MKVVFLTQTPISGSSARYRVYQYIDYLQANGVDCTVSPAVSEEILNDYRRTDAILGRMRFYSSQFFKRLIDSFKVSKYDVVFLQRDLLIHLYPFIENIISVFNKNIIFDFDDAIHLFPPNKNPNFLFKMFWDRKKIERIAKLSKHVIVSNRLLYEYARRFSSNVTLIPISVNLKLYNDRVKNTNNSGVLHIGWIGSPATLYYLRSISDAFKSLSKKYNIVLDVIGGGDFYLEGVKIINKEWSLDTEIDDIYEFDIGIMPLTADQWSMAKSGTKLLQCMAARIPVVCSPIGANCDIVKNGESGFFAKTEEEWVKRLSLLIESPALREKLGKAGRINVEKYYSTAANAPKLLNVLKAVGSTI